MGLQRLGRHMATWAGNIPVGACSVLVTIWLPEPVMSWSPYGDPGMERLGRYMVIWAGNVWSPYGDPALQRPGRHMRTRAQAVLLEAERICWCEKSSVQRE
ncbi:unnamed protein product [Brassica rapa subsp. narinosa]|uniref:Uncharacterized protein n=1 Tax=Brassica campestris TaxID=3711 RepID=M4EME9_BRACM